MTLFNMTLRASLLIHINYTHTGEDTSESYLLCKRKISLIQLLPYICVLVSAGIELIVFLVAGTVLCF